MILSSLHRLFLRVGVWAMLVVVSSPVPAEVQYGQLLSELKSTLADETRREAAVYAGQDRALLCGYCHGTDGNSLKDEVPNLAGQNPAYLLQQINKFASGERKDYVMNSLAGNFSAGEQISLAIFYSQQQLKPAMVDQRLARKGKDIYRKNCQSCHGENGHGKNEFARLAGQKEAYTIKTLQRFRGNAFNKEAAADKSKRHNPLMESVTSKLTDQDIERLAAYLAQLR